MICTYLYLVSLRFPVMIIALFNMPIILINCALWPPSYKYSIIVVSEFDLGDIL